VEADVAVPDAPHEGLILGWGEPHQVTATATVREQVEAHINRAHAHLTKEPAMTDQTTDEVITYEDLLNNRPQRFTVQRHQAFEESGVIIVSAAPGIQGVSMHPGTQLNYKADQDGNPFAYSIGHAEGVELEGPSGDAAESRLDDRAGPTTSSTTPAPQDSTTGLTPEPQAPSDSDVTPEPQAQSQTDISLQDDRDDDGNTVAVESVDEDELNARKERLDEIGDNDKWPVSKGGGWFVLSDGRQVQSKQEAEAEQALLDGPGDDEDEDDDA
jgi:hypothetical protein